MTDLDEELRQIKGTADAATPGPWSSYCWSSDETGPVTIAIEGTGEQLADVFGNAADATSAPRDAKFIASARTDVDRLIACIEAGQAHRIDGFSTVSGITYLACKCGWRVSSSFASVDDFDTHRTEQQLKALRGGQ